MKIVVILLAVAGLALIFAARRMEMPAVRANAKLVGGTAMLVALGLAVYDAIKD
jgi:type IV secretory pathway protease TraF